CATTPSGECFSTSTPPSSSWAPQRRITLRWCNSRVSITTCCVAGPIPDVLRQVLFQAHWLLGITAGVVLSVVGVTGASLSFGADLMRRLNRDVMEVTPQPQALALTELVSRAQEAIPDRRISAIGVSSDRHAAVRITFERTGGSGSTNAGARRGDVR